jgi:toxin ParE1/3/4
VQAQTYAAVLSAALAALTDGPTAVGAKERREIGNRMFTLHVARGGQRGRHLVLFGTTLGKHERHIEVLRILHDAMDLSRHVAPT